MCSQRHSDAALLREEQASLDCLITKNRPEMGLERVGRFIHHVPILLANERKSAIERGIHLSRIPNQSRPFLWMDLASYFSKMVFWEDHLAFYSLFHSPTISSHGSTRRLVDLSTISNGSTSFGSGLLRTLPGSGRSAGASCGRHQARDEAFCSQGPPR
jgi:hypothetical protein